MNTMSMTKIKKAIKENDLGVIYEYLSKTTTKFKNTYGAVFLNSNLEDKFFDEAFLEITGECGKLDNEKISLISYYSTGIVNRIKDIIKSYNDEEIFDVINRYIEKDIKVKADREEDEYIAVLEEIDIFCLRLGIVLPEYVIKKVLNYNEKVNSLVEGYISCCIKNGIISIGKLKVSTGVVTSKLLEFYCKDNDIKINYDDKVSNRNKKSGMIGDYNSLDPVNMYLKDINAIPLLSPLEEIKLFLEYHAGNKEARTKIVEANLRLVTSVAKRYCGSGDFLDLVQYGNLGLYKAIDMFNEYSGYKFSSYATWWIDQQIGRNMKNEMNEIRIPISLYDDVKKYNKVKREMELEFGNGVDEYEIAKRLGWSIDKVFKVQNAMIDVTSLNKVIGDESDNHELGDIVSSDESLEDDVLQNINADELHKAIINALDSIKISEQKRNIILYRFGFVTGRIETLEDTGAKFGYKAGSGRERIRQIESEVLSKLRIPRIRRELAYFLDNPEGGLSNILGGSLIDDDHSWNKRMSKKKVKKTTPQIYPNYDTTRKSDDTWGEVHVKIGEKVGRTDEATSSTNVLSDSEKEKFLKGSSGADYETIRRNDLKKRGTLRSISSDISLDDSKKINDLDSVVYQAKNVEDLTIDFNDGVESREEVVKVEDATKANLEVTPYGTENTKKDRELYDSDNDTSDGSNEVSESVITKKMNESLKNVPRYENDLSSEKVLLEKDKKNTDGVDSTWNDWNVDSSNNVSKVSDNTISNDVLDSEKNESHDLSIEIDSSLKNISSTCSLDEEIKNNDSNLSLEQDNNSFISNKLVKLKKKFSMIDDDIFEEIVSSLSKRQLGILLKKEDSSLTQDENRYYLSGVIPCIKNRILNQVMLGRLSVNVLYEYNIRFGSITIDGKEIIDDYVPKKRNLSLEEEFDMVPEDILKGITSTFPEEHQRIIEKRKTSSLSHQEKGIYYCTILPKVRRRLAREVKLGNLSQEILKEYNITPLKDEKTYKQKKKKGTKHNLSLKEKYNKINGEIMDSIINSFLEKHQEIIKKHGKSPLTKRELYTYNTTIMRNVKIALAHQAFLGNIPLDVIREYDIEPKEDTRSQFRRGLGSNKKNTSGKENLENVVIMIDGTNKDSVNSMHGVLSDDSKLKPTSTSNKTSMPSTPSNVMVSNKKTEFLKQTEGKQEKNIKEYEFKNMQVEKNNDLSIKYVSSKSPLKKMYPEIADEMLDGFVSCLSENLQTLVEKQARCALSKKERLDFCTQVTPKIKRMIAEQVFLGNLDKSILDEYDIKPVTRVVNVRPRKNNKDLELNSDSKQLSDNVRLRIISKDAESISKQLSDSGILKARLLTIVNGCETKELDDIECIFYDIFDPCYLNDEMNAKMFGYIVLRFGYLDGNNYSDKTISRVLSDEDIDACRKNILLYSRYEVKKLKDEVSKKKYKKL